MIASTPLFLDESTLQFCPCPQILQIMEVEGYNCFIGEEIVHGVRHLKCADWIASQLAQGRVAPHRITRLDDIRLVTKIERRCGASRGEICSYVAAKRENGIVVAHDALAHDLLQRHIPGVVAIEPAHFLRDAHLFDNVVFVPASSTDQLQKSTDSQFSRVRST